MKIRIILLFLITVAAGLSSCGTSFRIPYLSLDLKPNYSTSDITFNYTYECENEDQRCVYNLYNKAASDMALYSVDEVLPHSGNIKFTGLTEGDYRFEFSVYSEKDGEYYLLKFLDKSFDFIVDLP